MRSAKLTPHAWLALLATTLVLTACQSPLDDPYSAGQQFRQLTEVLLEDASQFLAGFCGAEPAVLLTGLAVVFYLGRRSS
jgi:hypothetical protein